jgi:hypothetical protein
MTDVAVDIQKYMNDKNDGWWADMKMAVDGAGNNLFAHNMPPVPDFAVSVIHYEGGSSDETFANPLHTRHPRVQVMIRHSLDNIAMDRANDVLKYLVQVKDQVINGTTYARIKNVGEPFELGPDSNNRARAVVNFEVSYYDTV